MKAVAVVVMLAALALAGCADEPKGFSKQNLFIDIDGTEQAGEAFAVGIPVWVAPGGAQAEDWGKIVRINRGNATATLRDTGAGMALWLEGTAPVTLEANDLFSTQTGSPERAYLDGGFSLGVGPGDAPLLLQERGNITITWQYEGVSPGCNLAANAVWTAPSGWTPADYEMWGYRSDGPLFATPPCVEN